jgi:hypothetical protein
MDPWNGHRSAVHGMPGLYTSSKGMTLVCAVLRLTGANSQDACSAGAGGNGSVGVGAAAVAGAVASAAAVGVMVAPDDTTGGFGAGTFIRS